MFATNRVIRGMVNPGAPALHRAEGFLKPGESVEVSMPIPPDATGMEWTFGSTGLPTTTFDTETHQGVIVGTITAGVKSVSWCIDICLKTKPKDSSQVISTLTTVFNGTTSEHEACTTIGDDPFCRNSCRPQGLDAEKAKHLLNCMDSVCAEAFMDMLACGFNWSLLLHLPDLVDDLTARKLAACAPGA